MAEILDVCCGSRMFWFDKQDDRALFGDIRAESHTLCDGRALEVSPDMQFDFRSLPFEDQSFSCVVFDPPHFESLGKSSWLAKKYGRLIGDWRDDIREGFSECFRVLKPNGVLIFKWNEYQIPLRDVLALTDEKPLFGNRKPAQAKTHWVAFMKGAA